jgi:hypothetical protein
MRSGLPMKKGSQTHLFVFLSQVAPTPQITPSQRSLHLPPIHTLGSMHGLLDEQMSGTHSPPGNGLPMKPSTQAQVGPLEVAMHWAPWPQYTPSHTGKIGNNIQVRMGRLCMKCKTLTDQ